MVSFPSRINEQHTRSAEVLRIVELVTHMVSQQWALSPTVYHHEDTEGAFFCDLKNVELFGERARFRHGDKC